MRSRIIQDMKGSRPKPRPKTRKKVLQTVSRPRHVSKLNITEYRQCQVEYFLLLSTHFYSQVSCIAIRNLDINHNEMINEKIFIYEEIR